MKDARNCKADDKNITQNHIWDMLSDEPDKYESER